MFADAGHRLAGARAGRDVRAWMPKPARGPHPAPPVKARVQMLLYTHPFNDAARPRACPPTQLVLGARHRRIARGSPPPAHPLLASTLRAPGLREDWRAWEKTSTGWTSADAGPGRAAAAG